MKAMLFSALLMAFSYFVLGDVTYTLLGIKFMPIFVIGSIKDKEDK